MRADLSTLPPESLQKIRQLIKERRDIVEKKIAGILVSLRDSQRTGRHDFQVTNFTAPKIIKELCADDPGLLVCVSEQELGQVVEGLLKIV